MPENHDQPEFWIPDNPDGSGWAEVDWASVSRGSRYHYQHGEPLEIAESKRPAVLQGRHPARNRTHHPA